MVLPPAVGGSVVLSLGRGVVCHPSTGGSVSRGRSPPPERIAPRLVAMPSSSSPLSRVPSPGTRFETRLLWRSRCSVRTRHTPRHPPGVMPRRARVGPSLGVRGADHIRGNFPVRTQTILSPSTSRTSEPDEPSSWSALSLPLSVLVSLATDSRGATPHTHYPQRPIVHSLDTSRSTSPRPDRLKSSPFSPPLVKTTVFVARGLLG